MTDRIRERSVVTESATWMRSPLAAPLIASAVALAFIAPTVLRSVSAWDTAEFQTVGPVLGTAHPTGFPAYVIVGWLASIVLQPFGEPAFRMDLLQAIFAALAVGGTVAIVDQLSSSRPIAVASGLVLASTLLFWRLSVHADPHMFHVALLAIIFALLLGWERRRRADDEALARHADRWLVAAAAVYGVAVANHSLALLLAPGIGLFVLAVEPDILRRWRFVALCAGALAVTVVALFLELPVRAWMGAPLVYAKPDTFSGFWYVVLAEQFTGSLVAPFSDLADKTIKVASVVNQDLGGFQFLFLVGFGAAVVRRPYAALLAGLASLIAVWALSPGYFSAAASSFDLTPYCLPLGFAAVAALRPRYALLSGVSVGITLWFAASYQNADIERYYLGPLLLLFTWLGLGVAEAASIVTEWAALGLPSGGGERGSVRAWLARTALPYEAGPARGAMPPARTRVVEPPSPRPQARPLAVDAGRAAPIVAAALAVAMLIPIPAAVQTRYDPVGEPGGANESGLHSDADWLNEVMAGLPKDSIVISWWSRSTTLWYGQKALGMRPDIFIADDRTRIDMGITQDVATGIEYFERENRPIFVIRYSKEEVDEVAQQFTLKSWFGDSMWQVLGTREATR